MLAAAIRGGAGVIVTANTRDFPATALAPHNIVAREPDGFVRDLLVASPDAAVPAFAADRGRLRNPAMSPAEYLAMLGRGGLADTAAALEAFSELL